LIGRPFGVMLSVAQQKIGIVTVPQAVCAPSHDRRAK
jgi:hypothetical protein